jgi:AraC-like DNA-binding protein
MGHLMAFTAYLRQAGAPVDRYLSRVGLPVSCHDPDLFVPLLRSWSFFATAARHEDPALGWRAGEYVGDHNLNAGLLRKLESAPTLLRAFHKLIRLSSAEASDVRIGIHERRDDVLFSTTYPGMREVPGYEASQAYQLGVFVDLIRYFLGQDWNPAEIGIEHPDIPVAAKEQFPGSRIMTQQPVGYVAVPRDCLHRAARRADLQPGVTNDPVLTANWDDVDRLREVLKAYLADGYPSAQFAAEIIDVSERTLARRLSDRGLKYGELIDEIRFVEAKRLLQQSGARIEDVGTAVGFRDQSNFARMFRRLGGLSPREFQKAALD